MTPPEPAGRGGTAARRAARGTAAARSAPAAPAGPGQPPGREARSDERAVRRQLDPDTLVALEEERDFLLRSLEDLEREHDAGDVDDTDYAELKDDYTARAARVLRAIDDRRTLASTSAPRRSWGRTAGILAVVAVLALGVGWFVFRDAGTRAPGEGLSGDGRQDSANLVLQANASTAAAQQALEQGDTEAARDHYQDAISAYSEALKLSPTNVEAITYRAWVLHTVALGGTSDEAAQLDAAALEGLDQAVTTDPTFADARVFRASMRSGMGDYAGAQADLDAVDPGQIPAAMNPRLDQLRAEVAAGLSGTSTTAAP